MLSSNLEGQSVPEEVSQKTGRMHLLMIGNGFYHEVGAVANKSSRRKKTAATLMARVFKKFKPGSRLRGQENIARGNDFPGC
jgi:hypothetical protein